MIYAIAILAALLIGYALGLRDGAEPSDIPQAGGPH